MQQRQDSMCDACGELDGQGVMAEPHQAMMSSGVPTSIGARRWVIDYRCRHCGHEWHLHWPISTGVRHGAYVR
jgi:hypothetical protein